MSVRPCIWILRIVQYPVTISNVNNLFPDFRLIWDLILTSYTIKGPSVWHAVQQNNHRVSFVFHLTTDLQKMPLGKLSFCILSYFTKTRENALNRPVYRAQGTVLQIIWTILIFFWKSAIFFHAFRSSKILGKGGEVSILWKQHPLVLGPFGSWINPVN